MEQRKLPFIVQHISNKGKISIPLFNSHNSIKQHKNSGNKRKPMEKISTIKGEQRNNRTDKPQQQQTPTYKKNGMHITTPESKKKIV